MGAQILCAMAALQDASVSSNQNTLIGCNRPY